MWFSVKVADFGISKRDDEGTATDSVMKGTPGYMAPERRGLIDTLEQVPTAADMWALGEVVHVMLTLKPTFDGKPRDLFKYVDGLLELPDLRLQEKQVTEAAIDFVRATMKPGPSDRMSAKGGLEHPWITTSSRRSSVAASVFSLEWVHPPFRPALFGQS